MHADKQNALTSDAKLDASDRYTVVMVTYNSAHLLDRCFERLRGGVSTLIVDNASKDKSVSKIREVAPHASILVNGFNEGFGKAANRALHEVETEFAILVSPDCLVEQSTIEQLIILADRWDSAAIISPILVEEDGNKTRCHDQDLFSREEISRSRKDEPFPSGDLCAGFVQNAVSLLRMKALKKTGLFDENIFLFYEDDDLCIRLRRDGWSLVLAPNLLAIHLSGTSSNLSRALLIRRRYYHMAWSRLYLEAKYRGRSRGFVLGITNFILFLGKLFSALITLNRTKITRDMARVEGTFDFLCGFSSCRSKESKK
ncbi:MAG: hypothetical protein CMM32_10345 [Rhodospirillaceae bacterium]|nr:hypothetical protein [Rhodospirillaceae bacterium]|tara:strand:- start:658 stop:1602 length:945 start_codon:yes stop_codon:yes gene_type:complete